MEINIFTDDIKVINVSEYYKNRIMFAVEYCIYIYLCVVGIM